jgi:anti-sigma regulatory factor (Ser/Thr protein kinase)
MTLQPAFPSHLDDSFAYHLAQGTWPAQELQALHVEYRPSVTVPGHVRSRARQLLAPHVTSPELIDTLLMLSELVANAVRHPVPQSGERIMVHVALASHQIRAEVCDSGHGFDLDGMQAARADADGCRGLPIVDTAASRWGASVDDGHCVWFELDR